MDDPGNRDLSRARNRLRHVLLPEWRRRLGEDLDERLITLAAAARRRAVRDEVAAGRWLASHARVVDASAIEVPVAPCENADETLRLLHRSLVGSDPGRTWLRRVRALERTGARVVGGGPVAAERRPGTLLLARTTAGLPQDVALSTGRGWVTFGDTGWMLRADSAPAARGHTLTVSVGAIEAPLRARARRPGDRVGDGDSSRSVGGLMQARGLSRHERDRWPLVVDARDRIVWIPDVAPPEPAVRGDSIVLSARRCTGGIDLGRSSYWFALASEEDPPVRVP